MFRSSSSRYMPAAPPPPAVTKMISCIQVEGEDHTVKGYLTLTPNVAIVSEEISDASVFEVKLFGSRYIRSLVPPPGS